MGRPRKQREVIVEEDESETENETDSRLVAEQQPDTTAEAEELQAIERIMRENDLSGGQVMIFRRGRTDPAPLYLASMPAEQFSVDEVSRLYGGGRYDFKFKDSRSKIRAQTRFGIDFRIKGEIDAPPTAPTPAPAVADNKDLTQLMFTMLQQSNQNMVAIVTAALGRRDEPRPDPWASLAPLITAAAPLLSKMVENKGPMGSIKEVLEVIRHAKKLGDGKDDDDSAFSGILSAFGNLLSQRAGAMAAPPPTQPMISGAGTTSINLPQVMMGQKSEDIPASTAPPAPEPTPMTPTDLVRQFARAQLPQFQRAAQRGTDPVSYADVLLDNLEDQAPQFVEPLLLMLRGPTWCQDVFGSHPLPYQPWFDGLRAALIDEEEEHKTDGK